MYVQLADVFDEGRVQRDITRTKLLSGICTTLLPMAFCHFPDVEYSIRNKKMAGDAPCLPCGSYLVPLGPAHPPLCT